MKTNKILIVADDSEPSIKAIKYGFGLARELGAEVTLISVIDVIRSLGNPDAGIFPDDMLASEQEKTKAFLINMKDKYSKGIETELLMPVGEIQETILKTALKVKAELIVTGTHGRTGLNKLFNGSVAESIIHESSIPVFVVPDRE
jgi:nucleotide-binding universal stress UspA family protein